MADDGILLLKYWLEVSPGEQTRRLESRINDPRKIWKLSDMDLKSYRRWYDYSRARDAMFAATDTAWAPWYIAHTDNKKRGRLNIISHLLSQVPYKPLTPPDVTLPRRQPAHGYIPARPASAAYPGAVLDRKKAGMTGTHLRRPCHLRAVLADDQVDAVGDKPETEDQASPDDHLIGVRVYPGPESGQEHLALNRPEAGVDLHGKVGR